MDHVEQEIHQVLSNHLQHEPSLLNEVYEQDEDFVIHQTTNKITLIKKGNLFLNDSLDIVPQLSVQHHIFLNIDKVMFAD
jgi:hypothetical protein